MAGGEGTRLAPYTRVLPKPLLPVGDRPILEIIVSQLREAGVTDIVLATGYLSNLLETYFGDGSAFGVDITYHHEEKKLGTVGSLASLDGLDEPFILMNGDILTSPLYTELLEAHRTSGAVATIAARQQKIDIDFGVLRLGPLRGKLRAIEGIDEKPSYHWPVSTGIYAFDPRVQDYVVRDEPLDFPELLDRLISAGEHVAAYDHSGYWMDIGQLHTLEVAVEEFEGSAEDFVRSAGVNPRGLVPPRTLTSGP